MKPKDVNSKVANFTFLVLGWFGKSEVIFVLNCRSGHGLACGCSSGAFFALESLHSFVARPANGYQQRRGSSFLVYADAVRNSHQDYKLLLFFVMNVSGRFLWRIL